MASGRVCEARTPSSGAIRGDWAGAKAVHAFVHSSRTVTPVLADVVEKNRLNQDAGNDDRADSSIHSPEIAPHEDLR